METARQQARGSASLRQELNARNLQRAGDLRHEVTFGRVASVLYDADLRGGHGNFIGASYRRICADEGWRRRLQKSYTGGAQVPRAQDRWRGELECANSSDALLMNVFCYPGVLRRAALCALLGVDRGLRPEFGVRAGLAMRRGEVDRTELDLQLGDLLIEAKLTETGFGTASRDRMLRYSGVEEVFEVEDLPWSAGGVRGYQLIRGVLAARAYGGKFLLLCDARRPGLQEPWFQVLRAIRSYDLRSRMALLHWQELASTLPPVLRGFLTEKYGMIPA